MKYLMIILGLSLAACGQAGGSGAIAKAPASIPAIEPGAGNIVVPTTPTTVDLTYYSETTMIGVPDGYVPFTGSCVEYNSNTYCWDDGEKQLSTSRDYCSFWQISGGQSEDCTAASKVDSLLEPTLVDANLLTQMSQGRTFVYGLTPTKLLATGTPTAVTCTLSGTTLDCVDFTIDLSQSAF